VGGDGAVDRVVEDLWWSLSTAGVTSEDDHWLGWVGKRGERADGPTARLPPTAGGSGVRWWWGWGRSIGRRL
jgi:hypothetical protein